jgi:hypothetical protein
MGVCEWMGVGVCKNHKEANVCVKRGQRISASICLFVCVRTHSHKQVCMHAHMCMY